MMKLVAINHADNETQCYLCGKPFVHKRISMFDSTTDLDIVHFIDKCLYCWELFEKKKALELELLNVEWLIFSKRGF
jgi:hypothetical protein